MSFRDPVPVTTPDSNSDPVSFAINSKIMLTAIIVILFVVILIVFFHLYSRWSRRFHRNRRFSAAIIFFADPSPSTVVTTHGLNPSVIKSLPTFTFSAATAQNAIECSVCLSEFEQSESGRVLPNCKHTFHVDCIDMWLHSHSSCPLCRSLVEPLTGGVKSATEEVAISISDSVSDDNQGSRPELCDTVRLGGTGTSDDSPPEYTRRKPPAIEVPRRENDLNRSHSFTSPMSRVISFKRILSRERRSASSSSVVYPPVVSPPGCSMSATEDDIELGREETR